MSPQQALADLRGDRLDSSQKFLELYKSIVETCEKIAPLQETVLGFKKKVEERQVTPSEAKTLRKDMDEVLQLYEKLEKTSAEIISLRKQIHPNERENEVNVIIETKAYLFKALCNNPAAEKGLKHAEEVIEERHKEIKAQFDEITRNISKHALE